MSVDCTNMNTYALQSNSKVNQELSTELAEIFLRFALPLVILILTTRKYQSVATNHHPVVSPGLVGKYPFLFLFIHLVSFLRPLGSSFFVFALLAAQSCKALSVLSLFTPSIRVFIRCSSHPPTSAHLSGRVFLSRTQSSIAHFSIQGMSTRFLARAVAHFTTVDFLSKYRKWYLEV